MDKLKMHSLDGVARNIEVIGQLFPNALTEVIRDGKVERAIDFDVLRQELSGCIVEGREERYQFTWPDKKKAMLAANAPITATLRPVVAESVGKDGTPGGFDSENLYIEGDNLEVLKLLQETYLGKVKMIYIDPPYNTGNDFVYEDDFAQSTSAYMENSGQYDEEGNRMVTNTESNGRFHTDWLNMIYPRLKLAKDLLTDDGVIFISIDDNEQENLKKCCDEIFGAVNHVGTIVVKSNPRGSMSASEVASMHEYLLLYTKNRFFANIIGHELSDAMTSEYKYQDEKGDYRLLGLRMRGGYWRRSERPNLYYPIYINPKDNTVSIIQTEDYQEIALPVQPSTMEDGTWRWSKEKVALDSSFLVAKKIRRGDDYIWDIYQKDYIKRENGRRTKAKSIWDDNDINYQNGATEIKTLLGKSGIFDYSKPVYLITQALRMLQFSSGDIILDFFSGSATTAHAVMQLNTEDGGHRKFIMVQLPEPCEEKSEAYKAGYKNICEIGKERIRRAGRKIKEEAGLTDPADLDIGFRCLRLDESNMKPVYYTPDEVKQTDLFSLVDNVKPDRTPEDLLFQVMLDLGVLLSSPIEVNKIAGKKVFNVAEGYLLACFDHDVTDETVKAIAQMKPKYAVFRDSSMANDSVATNFDQIFETYSPDTVRKVL